MLDATAAVGGALATETGDGFLLTFATPSDAIAAAVAAQRRLALEPWPESSDVRVRMAVHAGEVATTAAGLVGLAIHHTARIASAAHGGQVLMSEAARVLSPHLPDGVELRDLGPHTLRDVGRTRLYQVVHPDLPNVFPRLRAAGGSANNLPTPLTSLIGRMSEISTAAGLLEQHRLVTLTGAGGCGKTRLGLAVASQCAAAFPDGAWFVALATLTNGAELAPAVGAALRVGVGTPDAEQLVDALADRAALLVLDNCEHLLDAVAPLSTSLLTACPQLKVLATSRELLGVSGEAVFRVPGLDVPPPGSARDQLEACEAAQLFSARAQLVAPGYEPGGDIDAVVEICRQVDGLPLAIELAAARLRTLSAREIVQRLGDRLRLLSSGSRGTLPRQKTLEATIDWSFRLLTPPEQQLLVRFAVFAGGADLDAVAAICGDEDREVADILDHITSLQDKSLIVVIDACGRASVRLLETVRQYAEERFSPSSEADAVRRRHADWYIDVALAIRRGPADGDFDHWVCRFRHDIANLLAAARWYLEREPGSALRLLVAAYLAFDLFEPEDPSYVPLLFDAVRAAESATLDDRAVALAVLAWESLIGAISADADSLQREADDAVSRMSDPDAVAVVLTLTTHHRPFLGARRSRMDEVAASIAAADRTGRFLVGCWTRLIMSEQVAPDVGRVVLEEAIAIADSHGHPRLAARARAQLAAVEAMAGRSQDALTLGRDALSSILVDVTVAYEYVDLLAVVEAEHGSLDVALALAEDHAARISGRPLSSAIAAWAYTALAHVRLLAGDIAGALEAAERAAPTLQNAPQTFSSVLNATTRAAVYRSQGRLREAAEALKFRRPRFTWKGATDGPMRTIEAWAALACALDRRSDAADLLATARAERAEQHMPPSPILRPGLEALSGEIGQPLGHPLDNAALESVTSDLTEAARQWPLPTSGFPDDSHQTTSRR